MGFSSGSLTFLSFLMLFISRSHQQFTTFVGDNGCEVKIPFVQSCGLGVGDRLQDSKLLELKRLLLEIVHGSNNFDIRSHQLDSQKERSPINLMETDRMEESCWGKMSSCLSDNQNVRIENIELSQSLQAQTSVVESSKTRVVLAEDQTYNCVSRLHELEAAATRDEKDTIIEGLQEVLLELEQSTLEMQQQHQAEVSQLRTSLSIQRRMVNRRDNTIDILRHRLNNSRAEKTQELDIDECTKRLELWRLQTNMLENEPLVQDQQINYPKSKEEELLISQPEAVIEEQILPETNMAYVEQPSMVFDQIASVKLGFELEAGIPSEEQTLKPIVEVGHITCEPEGETTQACELLPTFSSSGAQRRCTFTRSASTDYSWSLLSYENLEKRVTDSSILPPANSNACFDEYYYLDFSSLVVDQSATLTSLPIIEKSQPQCFTFWYYLMYDFNRGKVYIDVKVGMSYEVRIWEDHTKGTRGWVKAYFDIPASISSKGFVIQLNAESNGPGFLSLNSVTLTRGRCAA